MREGSDPGLQIRAGERGVVDNEGLLLPILQGPALGPSGPRKLLPNSSLALELGPSHKCFWVMMALYLSPGLLGMGDRGEQCSFCTGV